MASNNDNNNDIRVIEGEIYKPILENSRDILYRLNLRTKSYDYISPSVKKILGYSSKELMDLGFQGIYDRTHPDDLAILEQHAAKLMESTVESDMPPIVEYRFRCKDSNYRWISNNRKICFDKNGLPTAIIGNIRDITESKKLQLKIAQSEQKYKSLFNNARVAFFRSSIEDGKILECNQMLAEVLGYDDVEECISDFVSSERYVDPGFRKRLIEQLKAKGSVENLQAQVFRKDGSTFWVSFSARIYSDLGVLEGAAIDITNLKMLTPTEYQVLELVIKGLSNSQIAAQLKRSIRTVEDHRANIMQKFDVDNLVDLVRAVLSCSTN